MADATVARPPAIPTIPSDLGNLRVTVIRATQAINALLRGSIGCTLRVTLAPGAIESTFSDSRIGPFTYIGLTPSTASAAAAIAAGLWVEAGKGAALIHHNSSAATDRTFVVALIG